MTGVIFVNFSGLGNGVAAAGLFKELEKLGGNWRYFHNDCGGLNDRHFVSALELSGFGGLYPGSWRRFCPSDWMAIVSYADHHNVSSFINLRNEGPLRDKGYAQFKNAFHDRFVFHDLDQRHRHGLGEANNLFEEHYRLVSEACGDVAPVSGWLRTIVGMPGSGTGPIGLFLAASCDIKAWPDDRWVELALSLAGRGEALVLFSGASDAEQAHACDIYARVRAVQPLADLRLAQNLSTIGLAGQIAACRLLVSNDTGAVHIAAAVDTPCVGLYFATCGSIWGGLSDKFKAVQSSFGLSCSEHKSGVGNCERYGGTCPAPCKGEVTVGRVMHVTDGLLASMEPRSKDIPCAVG